MSVSVSKDEPIAMVGYWCRVPGALGPSRFWENLCRRQESIATIPAEQLRHAGVAEHLIANPLYVPRRGLLAEADAFDAKLFGVPPTEAVLTDPQHRQFLECAWLALADAGYCPDAGLGRVGVFAAQSTNGYIADCMEIEQRENRRFQAEICCAPGHLASSVAYRLNLEGPAVSIQSACSSSLVAVHLACRALQARDCDAALAGGVSIGWPQTVGYLHQEGGIMSRDGHCRPFDRDASGTVRGEGVGLVVLKRLDEALRDRDSIRAIIRGSAISNDGGNRAGYSAPSAKGQVRAIREAMRRADIVPKDVKYIEAHGTATSLGDAIELDALLEAMAAPRKLLVGSVKGNIGHLDAAAGVVSLIKTVMMVEHGRLAPTLHHRSFSDELGSDPDVEVPFDATDWPDGPQVAGVSSFGLGGTNAHLVIGAGPAEVPSADEGDYAVLLSAATPEALAHLRTDLAAAICAKPGLALRDIAHTLAVGRREMRFRRAIVASSTADLRIRLVSGCRTDFADSGSPSAFRFGDTMDNAALSWFASLYTSDPALRAGFDRLSDKLSTRCRIDLRECLLSRRADGAVTLLAACAGYALARRMIGLDVRPAWVSGTGIGTAVAAEIADVIDIDLLAAILSAHHTHHGGGDLKDALSAHIDESALGVPAFPWKDASSGEAIKPSQAMTTEAWAALLERTAPGRLSEPLTIGDGGHRLGGTNSPPALELLGRCWELGTPYNRREFASGDRPCRIPLPHPPLVRTRFAPPAPSRSTQSGAGSAPARPERAAAFQEATSVDQAALLLRCVKAVLGNDEITLEDDFFQVGGCSLTALDLHERLAREAGVEVPLKEIFASENLHAIVRTIERTLAGTVSARGGEVAGTTKVDAEELVIRCVRDVLGIADVQIASNFFDIGGCSITALDLHERIRAASGYRLSLHDIFEAPSLAEISQCLTEAHLESADPKGRIRDASDSISPVATIRATGQQNDPCARAECGPSFSVFFFSGESAAPSDNLYGLVLGAARFGDLRGFEAVWLPERHFHRFGAAFPAPAVLASAIAATTTRIGVRAGSVVLPLHHPVRVAEEWSVVDHLSSGRAGISFAPGFHPTDFVGHEAAYETRREAFWPAVDLVRGLWRGESYRALDGMGRSVEVAVHPAPVQRELPAWITASDKQETFARAGEIGANVLSALMGQTPDQLAANIAAYRNARRAAGHVGPGRVTVMLHTFVHTDPVVVDRVGQSALRRYLETHLDFAALRSDYGRANELDPDGRSALLDHAVKKYMSGRALIGTPTECRKRVAFLSGIGVDEIACLVDFGPAPQDILGSLEEVARMITKVGSSGEIAATARPGAEVV